MSLQDNLKGKFSSILLKWNLEKNKRKMPWKGEKEPYKIWISEIILQQTRVEQGLDYYKKFVEKFPDIHKLAAADDTEIYKLWEGLGYYNRCKNLIETARFISNNRNGIFPDNYEEILTLKGIGSYTASALASFAFNLPHAVIDGNVLRVLARVFGVKKNSGSSGGKKYFTKLADDLLDKKYPGKYNQALMDFGAIICKPASPQCNVCVFRKHCFAFQNSLISKLPVKKKKNKIRTRWFYYLVLKYKTQVYIKQRTENDIWKNLYEFVLIETDTQTTIEAILTKAVKKGIIPKANYTLQSVSPIQSQLLSHQKISGQFINLILKSAPSIPGLVAVSPDQRAKYAFPKFINSYFRQ